MFSCRLYDRWTYEVKRLIGEKHVQGQFVTAYSTWLGQGSQSLERSVKKNSIYKYSPSLYKALITNTWTFPETMKIHSILKQLSGWLTDWVRKFSCIYSLRKLIIWNRYQSPEKISSSIVIVKILVKSTKFFRNFRNRLQDYTESQSRKLKF
jgi:hypothetical protein